MFQMALKAFQISQWEMDSIIPILQMRKMKLRKTERLAQGHTISKGQNQKLKSGFLRTLGPRLLLLGHNYHPPEQRSCEPTPPST